MIHKCFGLLCLLYHVAAIKRYYASESCGHVYGPDFLTVLEFDQGVEYIKNKPSTDQNLAPPLQLRNKVWECVIVVKGMPSTTTNRSIGLHWRDFHIWDRDIDVASESVNACGKAYVTIYAGADTSSARSWTMCGKDTKREFFEFTGDFITFKFYADFRRNASYTYPPTTAPPPTRPRPPQVNCTDPRDVTDNMTSNFPLCSTTTARPSTTPKDYYPYPELYFRADVTSFDYECTKTVPEVVLKCNDSRRCLDVSLMCDFLLSQNCKTAAYPQDKTDQSRDYPSYCFRKDTTTTEGPTTTEAPSAPFNWRPIVAIIGAAVALLLLGWCCWRPGYLPWRLSRLRNVPFLNTQRFVCCRGPTACCPCLKCCAAQGTEDPSYIDSFVSTRPGRKSTLNMNPFTNGSKVDAVPYRRLQNPGGPSRKYSVRGSTGYAASLSPSSYYGNDPNNFASDWLKFISSDGGHLREQR